MYHKSSFDDDKIKLLADIKISKKNLRVYQDCLLKFGKSWQKTVEFEKEYFDSLMVELVDIKKRYIKEGVDDAELHS